ncbi:unnamed protein product [Caenorhabditis angaria]|uniref:Uncharacterized protein n=1 Tax=Caenorhabditis angaria TaxID=860376 RepID=A0A9P1I9W7_9PELO|nr:unnamed protein product [Caenorhabditis angaria]
MFSKLLTTSLLVALALAAPSTEEGKSTKRRQYIARPVVAAAPVLAAPVAAPLLQQPAVVAPTVVAPVGQCPGGPSLPIECDPKRPWPQCPPQSYCYATNSVDIGPYFCCPIWSTYGAAWRPATPFYNYVPPVPSNWPVDVQRMAAAWPVGAVALPVKARKQAKEDGDDEEKIGSAIDGWVERQAKL